MLGLSPSTVSQHVQAFLTDGIVVEGTAGESSGGRRPRELRLAATDEYHGVVDLGGKHARVGVVGRGGEIVDTSDLAIDLQDGAEPVVAEVADEIRRLVAAPGIEGRLVGVGMALPGPVNVESGMVENPSRMPGWPGRDIGALLREVTGVPAIVENDANAMALGEHFAHVPLASHSITVKAGTAIGAGVVVGGDLYRGAGGVAGDITHTRVASAGDTPCSCGNRGCLETVASGSALVRLLGDRGYDVRSTGDVIDIVRDADPVATTLARSAGTHLGEVLCAVVNFFNPGSVYIGGALATLEPFVSAIRSQLYAGSHPMVTRELRIAPAKLGADATLIGLARLLDESLVPV